MTKIKYLFINSEEKKVPPQINLLLLITCCKNRYEIKSFLLICAKLRWIFDFILFYFILFFKWHHQKKYFLLYFYYVRNLQFLNEVLGFYFIFPKSNNFQITLKQNNFFTFKLLNHIKYINVFFFIYFILFFNFPSTLDWPQS